MGRWSRPCVAAPGWERCQNTCLPAAALTVTQTHAAAPASQTANLTVEAPVYLDGREIARASAKYMGQQLAYLEGLT